MEDFTRLAFDTITLCAMNYRCVYLAIARALRSRCTDGFYSLNNFYKVCAPFQCTSDCC